ncbi:MAG: hypothetical protein C0624_03975 [Desulfuromonas sp.]|nr:MAG: hypothetical protein C0624_03975 [Desulfuromonas sp.]
MDTTQLKDLLADPESIAVLASGSPEGEPNVAVFGSPRLLDDGRVMLALGDNLTWENLSRTRRATLMVFKPGEHIFRWQGVRAYLELDDEETEGALFQELLASVERQAGAMAARAVRRAVFLQVKRLRPLIDMSRS